MRIYLSARYARRQELNLYREQLAVHGHIVTSRWLDGAHESLDDGSPGALSHGAGAWAAADVVDVLSSDAMVCFTDPADEPLVGGITRGGMHVEFGYALASYKLLYIVGPRTNVFHWLPPVRQFDTWDAFLLSLNICVKCGRERGSVVHTKMSEGGHPFGGS